MQRPCDGNVLGLSRKRVETRVAGTEEMGREVVRDEVRVTEGLVGHRKDIGFCSEGDSSFSGFGAERRDLTCLLKGGVILAHLLKGYKGT